MELINSELLVYLLELAENNPRLRQNHDLRTSVDDGGQRMLNAMMPGTKVPIHRHPMSNENVLVLCGKLIEIFYTEDGCETERCLLDSSVGKFGCVIPAGVWHSVEILKPTVIYEAKDGRYGQDGSESLDDYKANKV